MLNRKKGRGNSMISTGIVGTPFQSNSPKRASWILVNTSAFAGPPISRIRSRAATIAGSSTPIPAIFMAKYALIVADRFAGPASKRLKPPSGSCWRLRYRTARVSRSRFTRSMRWRSTLGFAGCVWPVAWLSEFSSTRIGVPFGLYHYTGATHGRELYIADVPLMDALSFTFLAYASFCLARAALSTRPAPRSVTAVVTGVLMMALDVVIDPLAVRGDRWFLGQVFTYAEPGIYFGVPFSN